MPATDPSRNGGFRRSLPALCTLDKTLKFMLWKESLRNFKESLRKTHFDSFSAVSAAPEACELANCAEFEAPAIYCTESRRRAQKTWNFRGARSARHKVPHPGTTQNYSKFTTTTRKEREKENLFLYPPPPRSRPKLAHFILYKKRSRLQNLKSIRFDLKKLWSNKFPIVFANENASKFEKNCLKFFEIFSKTTGSEALGRGQLLASPISESNVPPDF